MTELHEKDSIMYVSGMDACLNRWFATYEDARASLDSIGGYLFPYKGQYFITESEAIRELGLDPEDPDWAKIGWDWVRPLDTQAWERLKGKRLSSNSISTSDET
ncbi:MULTISPECIES: hypothetical protein [Nostocales]|uniref:Uncharacterized protein n=1 Tax=Tolypothrix campylonemoides VB511288_2 TaxID=3232311 RepID=A0ABW8XNL7_9CYAN